DFEPIITDLRPMDLRIFATEPMGLRDRMLGTPMEQRFSYDAKLRMLFIDLRQLTIVCDREIERIRSEVERRVAPLGHRVHGIVNYRALRIAPAARDSYRRMLKALEEKYFFEITRYGMSDALRPLGPISSIEAPQHRMESAPRHDATMPLLAAG